jgi:1,5-anhydro-D-fructose reductase (1,5-anhydro-D-mannitol-forming)
MAIRWGIIGASKVAREFVIDAIRAQPDGEVVAVMSSDPDRAREYARAEGIPACYTDISAMFAGTPIDAVYISTTNELHHAQTLAAAKAGKHVLCEKPLAMSVADAREMMEACRDAGVVMATNHHLRNAATHRAMRDAVKAGRIGRPMAARLAVAFHVPPHLGGWRMSRPDAGGGIVLDTTTHCVDSLRFVLDDDPVEVTSMTQMGGLAQVGLEDGAMSIFRFRSGLIAQTHESFMAMAAPIGFEVLGTAGTLVGRDVMYQRPLGGVTLSTAEGTTELPSPSENLYVRGIGQFHAAIRGEGRPAASAADGVWSLAAALAVLESARTGRAVKIDPGL